MTDLIISNSRITLTCGAKNSGAITSLVLDGQELLSFTTKTEGIQNKWRFNSRAYSATCNEGGAAGELPGNDSSSRFISGDSTDEIISTSTYTAYDVPLDYNGQTLECSANKFSKRIRANFLGNPGIVEIREVYELYSLVAGETISWLLEANLVSSLNTFSLFDAQPQGLNLPAAPPQVLGITDATGLNIPQSTYGGMVCSTPDQSLAIGLYTHGPSFNKNQQFHGALSAQNPSEKSVATAQEGTGKDILLSVGRHHRTQYLCVGTYTEVLNQFIQLYNHLTNTVVVPPPVVATKLVAVPSQITTSQNTAFTVTVSAVSPFGVVDTAYQGTVTCVLQSATVNGVLSGTLAQTLVNGVTQFTDLSIDTSGDYQVVFMSGTLAPSTVAVTLPNPVPSVNLLNPNTALQSSGEFTLQVFGDNFVPNSVVRWRGVDRATQYVDVDHLSAVILDSDTFAPGTVSVKVFNPTPGGGLSNSLPFVITPSAEPLTFRDSWKGDYVNPISDIRPYDFGSGLQHLVSMDVGGWSILNPTLGASNPSLEAAFENTEGAPQAIAAQYDAIANASDKRAWIASGRVRKAIRLSDAVRMDDEDTYFNGVGVDTREYVQDLEVDQTNSLLYTLTLIGGLYCESIATPSAPVTAATALNLKPFLVAGETCVDLAIWTEPGQEALFVLTSARIIVVKNISGVLTYISTSEALLSATDTNPIAANSITALKPRITERLQIGLDSDGLLVAYVVTQCAGYELPGKATRPFARLIVLCDLDLAGSYDAPKFKQTYTIGADAGKTYHVFYNPFPVSPANWQAYVGSAIPVSYSDGSNTVQKHDYSVYQLKFVEVGADQYLYVAHGSRNQVRKIDVSHAFTTGIVVGPIISCSPDFVPDVSPPTTTFARDIAQIDVDPTNSDRFVVVEYENVGTRLIDESVNPRLNTMLDDSKQTQTCQHNHAVVALSGYAWTLWSVDFRFSQHGFKVFDVSTNSPTVLYKKGWPMAVDGAVAYEPNRIYTLTFGSVLTWKPTGPGGAWEIDEAAQQPNRVDNPDIPGTWLNLNTEEIDIGLDVSGPGDDRLFIATGTSGFTEMKLDSITKHPGAPRFFTQPQYFTGVPDARLPGWPIYTPGAYYTNDCFYCVIDGVPHVLSDVINRASAEWALLAWAYNSGTDEWDFVDAAIVPSAFPQYTAPFTLNIHVTEDLDNRFAFVGAHAAYFVVRLDELVSHGRMTVCDVQFTNTFATNCGGLATSLGRLFVTLEETAAEPDGSVIIYDFDTTTGVVDVSNPVQVLTKSSIPLPANHPWSFVWKTRFHTLDAATGSGALYLCTENGTVIEFLYSGTTAAPAQRYLFMDTQPTSGLTDHQFPINVSSHIDSPLGVLDTTEGGSVTISLVPENGSSLGSLFGVVTAPMVAGRASFVGLSIDLRGDYHVIAAHNPAPGGNPAIEIASSPTTSIFNRRPILTSISPTYQVPTSTQNVVLTARGSRFVNYDSQINFNGTLRPTTMVDDGTLFTVLSPPLLAVSGTYPVYVWTEGATTEQSALTLSLLVSPLVVPPTLSPATDLVFESTALTPLYVNQTFNYVVKAVAPSGTTNPNTTGGVRFSASPAPGSSGLMSGTILVPFVNGLASFFGQINDQGQYLFKATHSPSSGAPLSPVSEAIDIFNRDPILSLLIPNPVHARQSAVGIQVFGSGFISGDSVATFDALTRTTTVVNSYELIITLNPLDIPTVGSHNIQVTNVNAQNPSNTLVLSVDSPIVSAPTSASLSTVVAASSTLVGGAAATNLITVTLRNTSNVRIPYRYVELSTDTELNSFTPTVGFTDGSGEFVSSMQSVEPGPHAIVVTADDGASGQIILTQQPIVTVTEYVGPLFMLAPVAQVFKEAGAGLFGGASAIACRTINTAGDYEVYIVGGTNYPNLLTDQAVQGFKTTLPASTGNAWIGRFDSDLNWLNGTFFGGSGATDVATGITLSEDLGVNGIFVSGLARSSNFPGGNPTANGPHSAFLANFDFTLNNLNWSTVLPNYSSVSNSIAVDTSGTPAVLYATGRTEYFSGPTPAAPTVFAVGTSKATPNSATLSLTQPAGTLTGKVLIAILCNRTISAIATASGWTQIDVGDTGVASVSAYWARYDSVGAGPYIFTFGAASRPHGVIIAVDGCRATGDIVGSALIPNSTPLATPTTLISASAISTTAKNSLVFWVAADDSANNRTSAYSGTNPTFVENVDGPITSGVMCLHVASGAKVDMGSTGSRTATLSTASNQYITGMFSLLPLDIVLTTSWPKDAGTIGFGLPVIGGNSAMILNKLNASTGAILKQTCIEGASSESSTGMDTLESGIIIDPAFPHNLTLYGTIQSTLQTPGTGLPAYNTFKGAGQTAEKSQGDALLFSLTNDFSTVLWSRYVGSDRGDDSSERTESTSFFGYGSTLAQTLGGDLLIAGRTGVHGIGLGLERGVPTPFQDEWSSPSPGTLAPDNLKDMFIMRLSSTGSTIVGSTFLGGGRGERPSQVIEARNKRIFIVGDTESIASNSWFSTPGTIPVIDVHANTAATGRRGYLASLDSQLTTIVNAFVLPSVGPDVVESVTGICNPKVGEYILCGNLKSDAFGNPGGIWIAKVQDDLGRVFYSPSSGPIDVSPPFPDPATWAVVPTAVSSTAITMQATTAIDAASPVYYSFEVPSGVTPGPGQVDSGFQLSSTYALGGLTASTSYPWVTRSQDGFGNITDYSSPILYVSTLAGADVAAPSPNPATWATVPYATGTTSISMTATTAGDPSGPVQYSFENLTIGAHNSGWQASSTYIDTGLTSGVGYSYRHQSRDSQVVPNVGGYSLTLAATTATSASIPTLSGITHPPENNDTGARSMLWPHMFGVRSTVDGHGLDTIVTVEVALDAGFTVEYRSFAAARGTITAIQAQNGHRKVGKYIRDCVPNTEYHVRFKAVNNAGTAYGPVTKITTPNIGVIGTNTVVLSWVTTQPTQISPTELRTYFRGADHRGNRFAYRFELFSDAGLTTLVEQYDGFYDGPSAPFVGGNPPVTTQPRADMWYDYNDLTPATDYWIRLTTWNSFGESTITKQVSTAATTNWTSTLTVDQKKPNNLWGFIHSDFRNPNSPYISKTVPVAFGVEEYDGNHTQHSTAGHGGGLAGEDLYTVYVDNTGFTTMWNMVKVSITDSSSNYILTRAARALRGVGGIIRVSGSLIGGDWSDANRSNTVNPTKEAYWDNGLTGGSQVFYAMTYVRIQAASAVARAIIKTPMTFTDTRGGLNGIYWKNLDFISFAVPSSKWSIFIPAGDDNAFGTLGFYNCLFTVDLASINATIATGTAQNPVTAFSGLGVQFHMRSTGMCTIDMRDCRFTPAQEHSAYLNSLGALGRTPSFLMRNEVLDYVIHNNPPGTPYAVGLQRANGRTMFQTDSRGDVVTPSGTQKGQEPGRGAIYFVDNIARSGTSSDLAGSLSIPGHQAPVYIENHTYVGNPDPAEDDAKVMNAVEDPGKGAWLNENGFAVESVTISKSDASTTSFNTSLNRAAAGLFIITSCEDFTVVDPMSISMNQSNIFGFTEDVPPGQPRTVGMATLSWAGTADNALRLSAAWPTGTWVDTRRVRHEYYSTNKGQPLFNNTAGAPQTNFTILSKGFVFEAIV
jgi:hypothetical protein